MKNIIQNIRKELKQNIDFKFKKGEIKFFKEPIKVYGVRSKIVHKIAQKYIPTLLRRPFQKCGDTKKEFFNLCEEMLKSNYHEEAMIVFIWTEKLTKFFAQADFKTFERWLKKYVDNWAKCDIFCTHTINYFVQNYPIVIPKIKKWASSKNRWLRRAAAVSFISSSRDFPQKKHLPHIFWIAKKLFKDEDDLVQKGYSWMLKVASQNFQKEVFDFIMKNKNQMPRVALRYAIEKMSRDFKTQVML
jgi:3-methyladenine DNA glycosylase AlkD